MKREFGNLTNNFDLLVVGGGIYGAWVAYDAALRGLKVALVEKGDWGSGTSSASSKLVHGGLRYLENFWFSLVRQSLRERELLLRLGPHRITPLRFSIPLYKKKGVHPLFLKAGLTLYDFMSKRGGFIESEPHKSLSKQELITSAPFLSTAHMTGGFEYTDAQTDDARFTLEIVSGALEAGVVAVNYAMVKKFIVKKGVLKGALVEDCESDKLLEVSASNTVNAAGPWASSLQGVPSYLKDQEQLVKGIHLTLPQMHPSQAFLLTAPQDQRIFFLLPWYGRTLVGTTDCFFNGNPDEVHVSSQDREYLLTAVNDYISESQFTEADIQSSFSGLRVLPADSGTKPASITRKWKLLNPMSGLFTSTGGKLTSARLEAEHTVDTLLGQQNNTLKGVTDNKPFPWMPIEKDWEAKGSNEGVRAGLDKETAEHCTRRYGNTLNRLLSTILESSGLEKRIDSAFPFCKGEIVHSAKLEMVIRLEDILRRRIPLAILTRLTEKTLRDAAELAGNVLGWSEEKKEREIIDFQKMIEFL